MPIMWLESRMTFQNRQRSYPPVWALFCFSVYLIRNIRWMLVGKVPPSLLLSFLGIPCPTTGCMRSLMALLHGDLHASLLWNPFTIPIILLLALSAWMLSRAGLKKTVIVLPSWMGAAWCGVLFVAWASKLLLGRTYW